MSTKNQKLFDIKTINSSKVEDILSNLNLIAERHKHEIVGDWDIFRLILNWELAATKLETNPQIPIELIEGEIIT